MVTLLVSMQQGHDSSRKCIVFRRREWEQPKSILLAINEKMFILGVGGVLQGRLVGYAGANGDPQWVDPSRSVHSCIWSLVMSCQLMHISKHILYKPCACRQKTVELHASSIRIRIKYDFRVHTIVSSFDMMIHRFSVYQVV